MIVMFYQTLYNHKIFYAKILLGNCRFLFATSANMISFLNEWAQVFRILEPQFCIIDSM